MREGIAEAYVLVKAAPQVGQRHGETVCCAGITPEGQWVRLFPVNFRQLKNEQKFKRWDRIRFHWRKPADDQRQESRRIDQDTVTIVGRLSEAHRAGFLGPLEVPGLRAEYEAKRTLALLRPQDPQFGYRRKTDEELADDVVRFEAAASQLDMFIEQAGKPYSPCPYAFEYRYNTIDGKRRSTCQDWETDATFFHWSRTMGEREALARMMDVFGEQYPKKGVVFAMGTHSQYPDTWLLNAVVRLDRFMQPRLL